MGERNMLLSAEHLYKDYGTKKLLEDATLYLPEGEKIGIIGLNGTGKSTLLRILAGLEPADGGTVAAARNLHISYLPQEPAMNQDYTVLQQVSSQQPASFREVQEYELRSMLDRLGIGDGEAKISALSGGQRKRVALCAALVRPADVLILDEPTNHLDSDMVIWLEERLSRFKGGIVMVTHDRYFLERVAGRIVELAEGRLFSYEANYSHYLALKAERYDMAVASERKRQALLRREYEWISRGARARSTKSRERIERYNALKEQEAPREAESIEMATAYSRMGKKLIELRNISKSFGDKRVIHDFSYNVKRDDRIGIVGKNGAGKSTLLNIIAGRLPADSGSVETGSTIRIGYFAQENQALDPNMRVYDFIRQVAAEVHTAEGTLSAAQLLERFLFDGNMQYGPIGKLSGGEKRRLYLLSILAAAPNVLLLDEPTNDLDIETLGILEDYLESFPGAVIAVSHDRYFLDKMAETIFALGEDGRIAGYTGNFSAYLEKRPSEALPEAAPRERQPKAAAPQKIKKLKLSFKEQRELETIDGDIEALEAQIKACAGEAESAGSDYVRLMELTGRLDSLRAALDEKTERWVYLNELVEKIQAQDGEA